jgi:hypothetical protein
MRSAAAHYTDDDLCLILRFQLELEQIRDQLASLREKDG